MPLLQGIRRCCGSVPKSCCEVDAPIGNKIPRKMIPTTAATFMVVSQNSITSYFRTLNILKAMGIPIAIDIHTAELIWVFGIQNDIVLAAATSFAGNATVYLLVIYSMFGVYVYQYIHPQAKP